MATMEDLETLAKSAEALAKMSKQELVEELARLGELVAKTEQELEAGALLKGDIRVLVFGGIAGGLLLGSAVTYMITKKRLEAKYEETLGEEIAKAKAHYNEIGKDRLRVTTVEPVEETAERALTSYQGREVPLTMDENADDPLPEEVEVEVDVTVRPNNVFTANQADVEWDQDREENIRLEQIDKPYVISVREYSESDYRNSSLAYFAEDGVLIDEREQPIPDIDAVINEANLERFGHGSNDRRIVYVRNDKLEMDFEVVRSEGSYAKEVLGLQHEEGPPIRRFRMSDRG